MVERYKLLNIIGALKSEYYAVRVSAGYRWLIWDSDGFWVVYERKPYTRKTTTIIETVDEIEAVKILIEN